MSPAPSLGMLIAATLPDSPNYWDHLLAAAKEFDLVSWADGQGRYSFRTLSEFNKSGIRVFDVTYYDGAFTVTEAKPRNYGPRCATELGDPGDIEGWAHTLYQIQDYLNNR